MKRIFIFSFLPLLFPGYASAQSYTYNHDPMKQAQITVMESGTGSLTPEWYYSMLHSSYASTAAVKNKTSFRTLAGENLYTQMDFAEKIDSAMTKRARIEALNMADRTGGAADLAWAMEGRKVTGSMDAFHRNIGRVILTGGTSGERDYWMQYYNAYLSALHNIQDAYMPNAQRKREYLRIYEDVERKNDLLLKYLVRLSNRKRLEEYLSMRADTCKADKHAITAMALGRWQGAVGHAGRSIEER